MFRAVNSIKMWTQRVKCYDHPISVYLTKFRTYLIVTLHVRFLSFHV